MMFDDYLDSVLNRGYGVSFTNDCHYGLMTIRVYNPDGEVSRNCQYDILSDERKVVDLVEEMIKELEVKLNAENH